tara:strand:+ start:1926 stop:3905 length:1980 start_codon:yes stop_codon:yes gene_type:complete
MNLSSIEKNKIDRVVVPLLIFVFALGIRLVYLWQFQRNPLFDVFPDSLDHFNFDQSAINFANGDLLARSVNNTFAPLYKYFLGILYWIFGRNLYVVYFFQFCMGSFSCALLYLIGRDLLGFREGVFAGLGLALYSTQIIYEGIILRASFISFLGVLSFYLLLKLKECPGKKLLLWTTLTLSLFFQARPNTLLCLPLICVFLFREVFPALSPEKPSIPWKLFFGTLFASFVPLLIQCYLVHGKFVFFDASGPHTFISGNIVNYSGVGFDSEIIDNYRRENILGYASNISFLVRHIFENPGQFFLLYVRKLYFFLNDFEAPTNISVYIFRDLSSFLKVLLNHYALISSLALIGMVALYKEGNKFFLLFAYVFSMTIAIILFLNEARYRIPAVPFFILFAAKGLGEIVTTFNERKMGRLMLQTAVFTILFIILAEPDGMTRARSNDYGNLGNAWIKKGQWGRAREAFQTGVDLNPNNAYAYINLGRVMAHMNERSEAAAAFKRAIALDSGKWQTHFNLGVLSSHSGRWVEAENHLLLAWTGSSHYPEIALQLGDLYGRMGRHEEAVTFLKEFLDHAPDRAEARFLLGVEYNVTGHPDKAITELKRVVELEPGHVQAWNNLGVIYSRFGRLQDAKNAFQSALVVDPDFSAVRKNLQALPKILP